MQQLINDLRSNSAIPFKSNEEKVIAEFTIKHMKGFAEWVDYKFYIKLSENPLNWSDAHGNVFTITELIEKYFESLK